MQLSHEDDAGMQLRKLQDIGNELIELTRELVTVGNELNAVKGRFSEIKAKIKLKKELMNVLKVTIRAENISSGGF